MILKTERLIIRHITKEDWKSIKKIWVDFKSSKYVRYSTPHSTNDEDVYAEIHKWERENKGTENKFFGVCQNDSIIGYIVLHKQENAYEIGYSFHSDFHGKGYAKESVLAILDYARELGIKRITAGAAINNIPSVALLKVLGFKQVGKERVSFYKDEFGKDMVFEGGIFELEIEV